MNKFLFFLLTIFLSLSEPKAQVSRYVVQLKHKGATTYSLANPSPYLSQRAVERRIRYNIPIDSTDLPVPVSYLSQIQNIPGVTILNISRWLNAITIQTTDANAIATINALPFVQEISTIAARPGTKINKHKEEIMTIPGASARPGQIKTDYFNYGANSFNEIHLHNGEFLHNLGLRGQGMQIAMMDGGYFHYTSLKAFDSVNANAQVISTWDFVSGNASVVEDNAHGMQCFSIIAANIPGQFIGKAPKASFHLFRTEDVSSEYPIEEFNWACGAEKADSAGADIISSSLGYGYGFNDPVPDYPYSDLNGDITISAKAADLAAKKGLLVFNAAGNSGNDYWRMITTPADGDSVVAVGAVSPSGTVASFSSYGPSADGRIKPDVASVGVSAMLQAPNNTIATSNGTSFACPNMAGLATCLWQGFPEFGNMRIVRALKEAGSTYNSPNDRIGYGVPDMKKAFIALVKEYATSSATINDCKVTLTWRSKDIMAMKYEIERKTLGDTAYLKIAEMEAQAGAILSNRNYEFIDPLNDITHGIISYRVRQVIDKEAATFTAIYIDTTAITINSACAATGMDQVRIAPNPAFDNSQISLIVETNYPVTNMPIAIYDMKGNLALKMHQSKGPGKISLNLPVAKLSKGKYIVKVFNGSKPIGTTSLLKL
ncbi:MAG: S8 family serine peptidase [Chitinophagaceae bacterium]